MRALLSALILAAAAVLAGCEAEDFITWGTVIGVEEIDTSEASNEPARSYEDLRVPEVAWRIEVRTDDGADMRVIQSGGRRHEPGERVPLLKRDDGELLL
jgi:hypothetical protein